MSRAMLGSRALHFSAIGARASSAWPLTTSNCDINFIADSPQ
jgi:hypothetical protein